MRLKMKARQEGNISDGGPVPSGQEGEASAAGPVCDRYGIQPLVRPVSVSLI